MGKGGLSSSCRCRVAIEILDKRIAILVPARTGWPARSRDIADDPPAGEEAFVGGGGRFPQGSGNMPGQGQSTRPSPKDRRPDC